MTGEELSLAAVCVCVLGGMIGNKARGSKAGQEASILLELVRPEHVRDGDTGPESRDRLELNR